MRCLREVDIKFFVGSVGEGCVGCEGFHGCKGVTGYCGGQDRAGGGIKLYSRSMLGVGIRGYVIEGFV